MHHRIWSIEDLDAATTEREPKVIIRAPGEASWGRISTVLGE
jgi:hypothetical protein